MKDFFKYVFATVVGIVISSVLLGMLCFFILLGIVASVGEEKKILVKDNSMLYLNLDQSITERTPENSLANLPLIGSDDSRSIGFPDLIRALKAAKNDPKIKGIYINVSAPQAGMATMLEVRQALIDFKSSKKPIIAYSEVYSQGAYYLASAANKIYLNPQGALEFKGFSSEITFFKGALEKLGVEAQIIRVGNYKSAVEPFINTEMSSYNRQQVSAYVQGLYQVFLDGIASSRLIPGDSLRQLANRYAIQQPEDALHYRLIDGLKYKDEVLSELRGMTHSSQKGDVPVISINDYAKNLPVPNTFNAKNKIAVIYANGDIVGGEGSDDEIGSERISRAIRQARLDDNIKAIVLRVNSGGGSALASEVIWREVLLSKKVKPLIASFGDVAASGGYYIGCAADSIFVQPNTITGSIGVFGIIPNFKNLLNEKLGITFDGVKTGEYADIMNTTRPLTSGERFIIQNSVNHVYDTFLTRVAEGRKKTKAQIDSIGGGHVWTGNDAIKIGLADRLGNFNDALAAAAKKAGLKDYTLVEYPEKIDKLKALLNEAKENISVYYAKKEFGEQYGLFQQLKKAATTSGVQTRMTYEVLIK